MLRDPHKFSQGLQENVFDRSSNGVVSGEHDDVLCRILVAGRKRLLAQLTDISWPLLSRTSSSAGSSCTSCPRASTASVITACSPTATAPCQRRPSWLS